MYDLYECNNNDTARFVLGKQGYPRLYVVGLNPSTANKEKSDTTVAKVEKAAKQNGYHGFIMLNLYPLRSTDPDQLPTNEDHQLIEENVNHLLNLAKHEKNPVFWAAWGEKILLRLYLEKSLKLLASGINDLGGSWINYGELSKYGHPRHPSRLAYSWQFYNFDISNYLHDLSKRID